MLLPSVDVLLGKGGGLMNIHVNLEPFYQTEPGTAKEAPPLNEMVEERNRKTRPDSVA